jgi:hypothetical protein
VILLVQWRRRKKGTERQRGLPFPIDESSQKKKGALAQLRERFAGQKHGRRENEYVEKLKELIKEHTKTGEDRLSGGIITPEDAEYLEKRGWANIDPYTDQLILTEEGQVILLGKKIQEKKKVLQSLTDWETEMLLKRRELEGKNP